MSPPIVIGRPARLARCAGSVAAGVAGCSHSTASTTLGHGAGGISAESGGGTDDRRG
jgi:hypothetical protein